MNSSDFIGLVMDDAPASELTDAVKQMLYTKSVGMVDELTPVIGAQMFDPTTNQPEEIEDQDV
jgi:hypothetical protein